MLNTGMGHGTSDIVACMDADDVIYPERLQKQLIVLHVDPVVTLCAKQAGQFPEAMVRAILSNTCAGKQAIWQNLALPMRYILSRPARLSGCCLTGIKTGSSTSHSHWSFIQAIQSDKK